MARATARPGAGASLGGFGALLDPRAAGYQDPLLVATTDGVGTKLKIAAAVGRHDTIGIDLVAMCVNDLVVQGAEPLLFLDYFATGKLDVAVGRDVVAGVAEGCRQAGCALAGGETAEMPGLYADGDYDLAGFAIGAVERDRVLPRGDVAVGDLVLGLASSGVHSNGYSLVRRIVEETGLTYADPAPFAPEQRLGQALLTPTRLYVRCLLEGIWAGSVKALAHITGGGLTENIPRVLPDGLGVALDAGAWTLPPVFRWLAQAGRLSHGELARTFNCGIGMVVIAASGAAEDLARDLTRRGETVFTIGELVPVLDGGPRVALTGTEAAWPG